MRCAVLGARPRYSRAALDEHLERRIDHAKACTRRGLVPLDKIGAHQGNMTKLQSRPFKCSACGSREVELWLFVNRVEADDFLQPL